MTHYLIDGYNWLFRTLSKSSEENLRWAREQLIRELSIKLSKANIEATLVFDSYYNPEPAERAHKSGILIYYTDKGQTADEYILDFIKYNQTPSQYTVVTSDNQLAWKARQKAAQSISIQEFKKMLERIYFKKKRVKHTIEKSAIKPELKMKRTLIDYYEEIFTKAFEESNKGKLENKPSKPLKTPKKKPLDPCDLISDLERWERIFEARRKDKDGA